MNLNVEDNTLNLIGAQGRMYPEEFLLQLVDHKFCGKGAEVR